MKRKNPISKKIKNSSKKRKKIIPTGGESITYNLETISQIQDITTKYYHDKFKFKVLEMFCTVVIKKNFITSSFNEVSSNHPDNFNLCWLDFNGVSEQTKFFDRNVKNKVIDGQDVFFFRKKNLLSKLSEDSTSFKLISSISKQGFYFIVKNVFEDLQNEFVLKGKNLKFQYHFENQGKIIRKLPDIFFGGKNEYEKSLLLLEFSQTLLLKIHNVIEENVRIERRWQ